MVANPNGGWITVSLPRGNPVGATARAGRIRQAAPHRAEKPNRASMLMRACEVSLNRNVPALRKQ